MTLSHKFTFHIPRFKWENELVPIDYAAFEKTLGDELNKLGITSFYTVVATGHYDGHDFDEDLLVVYCNKDVACSVADMFESLCKKYNDLLCQDSYAYEKDGEMIIFR